MTEIDRRALLGVAGAGLVLAGCTQKETPKADKEKKQVCFDLEPRRGKLGALGMYPPYEAEGIHKDNDSDDRRPVNINGPFQYDSVCLVYMKFDAKGLKAKHAHFDRSIIKDLGSFLAENFTAVRTSNEWSKVNAPYKHKENFDKWGFGRRSMMYFFVDNERYYEFDDVIFVQFSPYSARLDIHGNQVPKNCNGCFLNPKILKTIWDDNKILSLENWYVDENGVDITSTNYQNYSMNIYLRSAAITNDDADGFNYVPIVVDPDTGNNGTDD